MATGDGEIFAVVGGCPFPISHFNSESVPLSSWFLLTLIASVFLGFYDVAKKLAVTDNAVAPVLLCNVSTAAVIWSVPMVGQALGLLGGGQSETLWDLTMRQHGLLFCKSAMVGTSWVFAFVALKRLPISIAAPVRSTGPLWTIVLAVLFAGERPLVGQWVGIVLILVSFFALSKIGSREGIAFHRSGAVGLMVAATLVGSCSGVYDKYLLQTVGFRPAVVQAWFSIYLVPVMIPMAVYWLRFDRIRSPFQWRWSIPLIAILLLGADYFYFVAVAEPGAMISVISPLRRCSTVVPFLFGIMALKEFNWRPKLVCLLVLFAGVFFISLA